MPKSENEVERDIAKFMLLRGWRRRRNHVGRIVMGDGSAAVVGIKGTPDWTFTRTVRPGLVEICHIEAKAEGKRPTGEHGKRQLEQIALLNHLGEHSTWANDVASFEQWYLQHFQ